MFLKRILTILAIVLEVRSEMNCIHLNNAEVSDDTNVSQCIADIIVKNDFSNAIIFSYENVNGGNMSHASVLHKVADNLVTNSIPMTFFNKDASSIHDESNDVFEGSSIIVTSIEDCKSVIDVTEILTQFSNRCLIVLRHFILTECDYTLRDLSRKLGNSDVVFIAEDKIKTSITVFTYVNEFDSTTCRLKSHTDLTYLNMCQNGSLDRDYVFPDKTPRDWRNCPINVGLGSLYPYNKSYNKTLQNFDVVERAEGSDVELLKIMARHFNASLNFYHIRTDAENVYLELSYLPFVLNGSLEVCAGGLYRIYGDVVSYSGIYSRQEIVWIYTVERNNRSWLTYMTKSDEVYIFIVIFICYTVVWSVVSYCDDGVMTVTHTLFSAWGALFAAASLQLARTNKQKILNLFYSVLCLHLYAYTSIQLFSYITIQGPPRVYKDIDQLSRADRPLYLVDKAKYFVDDEKYITFANSSGSCQDFDDCVTKALDNKGTTLLVDGLLAPLQTSTAINGEARLLKVVEPILIVYHEMIFRKESSLSGRFETVMSRLFEAGICQKLYAESIGTLVMDKAYRANKDILSYSYRCEVGCKITLSQCAGAFYVWVLGSILSCCVFLSEIAISSQNN